MEPKLKNLREWVALLFLLFVALDLAAAQYGIGLRASAPFAPDSGTGEIASLIDGPRGAYRNTYVTPRQLVVLYGLLGAAAAALFALLGVIVAHGIYRLRAGRQRPLFRKSGS